MVKILIVDDSFFSQKITANLIEKYLNNAEIYLANDGQEGFEKYKEIKPDYIFIDLLMPKINGMELVRLIKGFNNEAKIIVLSADIQKSVREEVEACNVMLFMNKPLNEEKAQLVCRMIRGDEDGREKN